MNLTKNVSGTWEQMNNYLRADLDTIQRNFNALQAELEALKTQVNTPAPVAPAIISAANKVTVPTGDFLSVVAIGAGLTGDGRATNPLSAVGGQVVSVNPSGALDGDGTIPSPLGVRVDGSTIVINGSNQLQAASVSPFLYFTTAVTTTFPSNLTIATTPIVVAAAASASIIVPIWWSIHTTKTGSWTNGGSPFQLFWVNNLGAKSNLQDLTSGYSGAGALTSFGFASGYNQAFISSGAYPLNQNLVITSNADFLSGAGASATTTFRVAYVVLPA